MSEAPGWAAAAGAVQRLGVLLEAGIAPNAAVRTVARATDSRVLADAAHAADSWELVERLRGALAYAPDRERTAWAPVVAGWVVAAETGAPLGPTLARLAEVLRGLAQTERSVEVALAGPLASARVLLLLPVVGVLFGLVLGFDTARVLFATPPGWLCLALGGALLALGALWSRRMLRRARRRAPAPGLAAELTAVALAGGLPPERALARVTAALVDTGLPADTASVVETLEFARGAGAPAAALLRAEAEEARRIAAADGERVAATLGVRLMLPLGVCVLPAFLLLAVVPVIVALVEQTVTR